MANIIQLTKTIYHYNIALSFAIGIDIGTIKIKLREIMLDDCDLPNPTLIAGNYACLTITDNGKGIPKGFTDRIFEPFFTTKSKGEGTGMGLSVIHGIVTNMNGFIKVYSELDKGTEFRIYLPVVDKLAEQLINNKIKISYEKGDEQILLIDDEETIIMMETEMLERLGYTVTSYTNSLEALGEFTKNYSKYDLVISDISMPDLTGIKLAAHMSEIKSDIPILLCTGFNESMDDANIKKNGIKGILTKPVIMRVLSREIRKILDKGQKYAER